MSEPSQAQPPRRGARFSLLTLVWLLTIAALGVGLYSSKQRNDRLRDRNEQIEAENKKYRNELGIFELEDPTQIHAIRVPSNDGEPHKYRIYLPPGQKYVACYQANYIPQHDVPEPRNRTELKPGHWLVTVDIKRELDRLSGEPLHGATARIRYQKSDDVNSGGTTMVGMGEHDADWIVNRETGQMSYGSQDIGKELELHEATQPLVLFRARAHSIVVLSRDTDGRPSSYSTKQIDGVTDGFMLWIAPEEDMENPSE